MRKHPYHLVDPSPWPLFAGLAAFVTTIGAVMYFHAYVGGGLVCSFGLLMVLYSMFVWWRDSARGRTLIVWTKSLDPDKRVQRSLRRQGASCWHTRVPALCTMDISTGCTPAVPNHKRSGCSLLAMTGARSAPGCPKGRCLHTALRAALRRLGPPLWGRFEQARSAWTSVSSADRLHVQAHGCPSQGTLRKQPEEAAQRVMSVGSLSSGPRFASDHPLFLLLVRLFRFAQQPHPQRRLFQGANNSCLAQHLRGTRERADRFPKGLGARSAPTLYISALWSYGPPSSRAREGTPAVGKQCVKGGDTRFETTCSRCFVLMHSDRTSCCIRIHQGKSNGRPTHPASDALFGEYYFCHLTQSFQSRTRVICLHSKAPKPRGAIPGGKNAVTFGAAATRIMSTSSSHHPEDTIGGSHVNAQGLKRSREKEPPKAKEALKVLSEAKGAVSLDSDNLMLGLKRVRDDLVNLGARAKVRDQQSVNQIAQTLLTDKYFWIVCYELIQYKKPLVFDGAISCSLRSQPVVLAHEYASSKIPQGVYTLQHLDYFSDLANRIKNGSFNWSPARRVEIQIPKGAANRLQRNLGRRPQATRGPTDRAQRKGRPLGRKRWPRNPKPFALARNEPCACIQVCKHPYISPKTPSANALGVQQSCTPIPGPIGTSLVLRTSQAHKATLCICGAQHRGPTRRLPSRVARQLCACTPVCEHLSVHKRVALTWLPRVVRSRGPHGIIHPRAGYARKAPRGWLSHPAGLYLSTKRLRSAQRDQIVQKGIQMILEQVAGYKFLECSYSFRQSCHHAIKDIKLGCHNAVWAIEVDIHKCFDSFDHKRLVSLIRSNYISLQMFLDLLYKALRVKYITLSGPVTNRMGTPASSLVSPLLCNIYLHELDQFVMASQELKPFRELVAAPRPTKRWTEVIRISKSEVRMLRLTLRSKGRRQYWKRLYKLRKQKIQDAINAGIPRYQWTNHTRMFKYFRYADDFILFVWGNLSDAQQIQRYIGNFLKSHLALHLSESNTKVTHLSEKPAKFCGFEIKVPKRSHSTFGQVLAHSMEVTNIVTQSKAMHAWCLRHGTQRKSDLGACTRDPIAAPEGGRAARGQREKGRGLRHNCRPLVRALRATQPSRSHRDQPRPSAELYQPLYLCAAEFRHSSIEKGCAAHLYKTHPFVSNAGIRINCNKRYLLEKLAEKGFVIKKGNKFRPTSYKPALELPLPHIVQAIQSIFQAIARYYGFADNYWVMNSLFQHYGRICCAATIAHKTRSTLGKVFKKYGLNLEVPIPGTNVRPVRE